MTDPIETLRLYIEGRTPGGLYPLEEAMVALAELERRAETEERLVRWLSKGRRIYKRNVHGDMRHYLEDYRTVTIHIGDTLEAALDEAGAP